MSTNFLVNFFVIFSSITLFVSAAPRVTIKNGTLEGFIQQSRKGRDIFSFTGIPYARPPLGDRRFKPPEPPIAWKGIKSAIANNTACLQPGDNGSEVSGNEDCLYINVYTPKLPNRKNKKQCTHYPVLVWFFGGSWAGGAGLIYGPKYLLDHDIVFVTMDYRLGALGFLSTGDDVLPGNIGFKDNVQALRWVQENIQAFGGDPNRVTIAGESSGGATVHLLVLSPLARGLFHQAISESGTAMNRFAYGTKEYAKSIANRFGRDLNCSTTTSRELIDCLRTKDAKDIILQPTHWENIPGFQEEVFRAVVETNHSGAFLIEEPTVSLNHGRFSHVTWLNGVNANDGAGGAIGIYVSPNDENLKLFNNNFFEIMPKIFIYSTNCPKESQNEISRKIREHYFNNKRVDESNRMQVLQMFSDGVFFVGSATPVKSHLHARSPVYFYEFAYRGSLSYSILFGDPKRDWGVSHGDELLYLFPVSELFFPDRQMSEQDFQVVDVMTTLWANFIRTGKPVPSITNQLPVMWKRVKTNALETFVIGGPGNFTMSKNVFKRALDFWSQLPCRAGLSYSSN